MQSANLPLTSSTILIPVPNNMLSLAVAGAAFVGPAAPISQLPQSRLCVPSMNFFQNFNKAFENDPRLADRKEINYTPGKSRNTPKYVQEKERRRKELQSKGLVDKDITDGDGDRDVMGEFFSQFKW